MKRRGAPEHDRPSIFMRLEAARRALTGDLNDSAFVNAVTGSGSGRGNGGHLVRLRHPSTEVRFKSRNLRGGGREIAITDPFARNFLRLLDLMVAGPSGAAVRAAIPKGDGLDEDLNKRIDASWKEWAEAPVSVDRQLTFAAVQHLWWRTQATDGEVFLRMITGFRNRHAFALQFIDSDQIDVNLNQEAYGSRLEIRMGIEIDEWGAPTGFIVRDNPDAAGFGYGRRRDPYFVPVYNPFTGQGEMLHDFVPMRGNQLRGLSWFAPVIEAAENRMMYAEAEMLAARRGAAQSTVLQARAENAADLMADEALIKPGMSEAQIDEIKRRKYQPTIEMDPDVIAAIPAGWEIASVDTDHPNAVYPAIIKSFLREYASALGPTYENLCNDRESVNFGSLRGGMILEREFFRYLFGRQIPGLLIPIRSKWLQASMLMGLASGGAQGLSLPGEDFRPYMATEYDPPGYDWIDPLKDVQASAVALQLGLVSRTELAAQRGKRWADIAVKLSKEKELAELLDIDVTPPGSSQADAKAMLNAEAAGGAQGGGGEKPGEKPGMKPGMKPGGNGNGKPKPARDDEVSNNRLAALLRHMR